MIVAASSEVIVEKYCFIIETVSAVADPDTMILPDWDGGEDGDLSARVGVYPGAGLAVPLRSDFGPITIVVDVRDDPADGGDPLIDGAGELGFHWAGQVRFDDLQLCMACLVQGPFEGLESITIPGREVDLDVSWFYAPRPGSDGLDEFRETVVVRISPAGSPAG